MARITSKITSIVSTDIPERASVVNTSGAEETIKRVDNYSRSSGEKQIQKHISKPTSPKPAFHVPISSQPASPNFTWIRVFTSVAFLIWFIGTVFLMYSVLEVPKHLNTYTPQQWAGLIAMVLSPLILIIISSYSLKQLARLTAQSQSLADTAERLTQPDDTVIRKSKIMAVAISNQVDEVNEKMSASLGRLATLEDVLNTQTGSLAKSNIDARQTTDYIAEILQGQSEALDNISGTFDERMLALSQMVTAHTDKLAHATQIAEQKIKEARISVEGATSKINAASDIVRSNTVQAAATLSASHQDINSLGNIIKERSLELDGVYKSHANNLTAMIEHLRDEQQNLGAVLEERLTKMRDLSLSAQASAESLIKASAAGKSTVEALAQSASLADTAVTARFNEMKDMVRYSNEHAESLSDKAAQRVKDSLEHTRKEIGRIEDDMADLQNRITTANRDSLELIPDDEHIISVEDVPLKQRRTRLKLKPIPQDTPIITERVAPRIDIQDVAHDQAPNQHEDADILDLYIEPNIEDNIYAKSPTTNLGPNISHDDKTNTPSQIHRDKTVQRTAPIEQTHDTKQGFSFRNLFGGRKSDEIDASLSIVNTTPPKPIPLTSPVTNTNLNHQHIETPDAETMIQALGQLGLSPNAVVDDGCIIEATNTRVSAGHEAMSRSVAERLSSPVKHLAKALSLDTMLSQQAIGFASAFDQSIENISTDREGVRNHLETEQGRAYLLCDAALNYGRV
ncbi:MAG: hypothetical protein JKX72_03280 [Robiginitomaculum sp.]|nr:hypothetical protein [Robiginitomaculum sp.]